MPDLSFNIEHAKALLIGISDFEFLPKIEPSENNIADLTEMLSNPAILGIKEKNIVHIINRRNDELLDEIYDFLTDSKNVDVETLFFYYVGHGFREKSSKELFLTGTNSKSSTIKVSGIPYNEIKQLIEQSQIQKRIVILDACHSGLAAMDGEWKNYTEKELDIRGTYTLASSAGNEKSFFSSTDRNTFFTSELIKLIKTGLPEPNPFISLDNIFNHLRINLKHSLPQRKTNLNTTDFYMFRNSSFDLYRIIENEGDTLFENAHYEQAKNKYLEVNFHKPTEKLRNKIEKCNDYILVAKKIEQQRLQADLQQRNAEDEKRREKAESKRKYEEEIKRKTNIELTIKQNDEHGVINRYRINPKLIRNLGLSVFVLFCIVLLVWLLFRKNSTENQLADGSSSTDSNLILPIKVQPRSDTIVQAKSSKSSVTPINQPVQKSLNKKKLQELVLVSKTAVIYFKENRYDIDLKYSLNNTVQTKNALAQLTTIINQANEIKEIIIDGYASPGSEESINAGISENRAKSGNGYIISLFQSKIKLENRDKDRTTINAMIDDAGKDINIVLQHHGPDWSGFVRLLQESKIKDKSNILKVINSIDDASRREQEIITMIAIYPELEKLIKYLDRVVITVNAYILQ